MPDEVVTLPVHPKHFADPDNPHEYWSTLPDTPEDYFAVTFDWSSTWNRLTEIALMTTSYGWYDDKTQAIPGPTIQTAHAILKLCRELNFYPPYITAYQNGRLALNWCTYDLADETEFGFFEIELINNYRVDVSLVSHGKLLEGEQYDVGISFNNPNSTLKILGVRKFIDRLLDCPLSFVRGEKILVA